MGWCMRSWVVVRPDRMHRVFYRDFHDYLVHGEGFVTWIATSTGIWIVNVVQDAHVASAPPRELIAMANLA